MSTLLIADDERTIREGIASAIDWKSLGVSRVLLASSGRKAFSLITTEKPDIAIVDIVMPEMDGMQLIAECRKSPQCPEFVIISGHDEFSYAREALKNNVRNYILKPCDTAEIAETVRSILQELERKRTLEADRREMQEKLDVLVPHAREQVFRNFLSGTHVTEARIDILRQWVDAQTNSLQLLVVCPAAENADLAGLKRVVDTEGALLPRPLSVILDSCLVVLFAQNRRSAVDELWARVRSEKLRAAVSAPGAFETLPQRYLVSCRALRRAALTDASAGRDMVLEASRSPYSPTVLKAMHYAEEHFADSSLSLGKAAKEVLRLNPDYLGKLFKKECGVGFCEYLMAVRMEHAKRIMGSTDDVRVYEVAWQVGFGDDSAYFSQVFRKYTGQLPGEYRKCHALPTLPGRESPRPVFSSPRRRPWV